MLLAVVAESSLLAQGGWQFGVKGGIGLTAFYGQVLWNHPSYKPLPRATWNAGVAVGYNAVYYNYGISVEAYYRRAQVAFRYEGDNNSAQRAVEELTLSWVELPVFVRFRSRGNMRTRTITYGGPYLEVGVAFLYLLSAEVERQSPQGSGRLSVEDALNQWLAAPALGFGVHQIGTPHVSLTHGLRILFPLNDALATDNLASVFFSARPYLKADRTTYLPSVQYLLSIIYKIPKHETVRRARVH